MLDHEKKTIEKQHQLERAKRISDAVDESGVKQTEIAKSCNVSSQAVFGWKTKGTIDKANLKVLARMTGYNFIYLMDGSGPEKPGMSGVKEDQAIYSTGPKGEELIRHIQSGRVSEATVVAMWPMIKKLMLE